MSERIRPFAPEDARELVEAIDAVCGSSPWMQTTRFEPTPAWLHALRDPSCPHHLLLVVEDDQGIVGWCRALPESCEDGRQEATLGIGLLPAWRNQGLGSALVRRSLAWARAVGYRRVHLWTHAGNAPAIHVFGCCGFAFTGRVGDAGLEMVCELQGLSDAEGEEHRDRFLS